MPVGMTIISEKLASASYIAHFIGKVCVRACARVCLCVCVSVCVPCHEACAAFRVVRQCTLQRSKLNVPSTGQWHVGMATSAQTPKGRGFSSSLGYFHSFNDYFNEQRQTQILARSHGRVSVPPECGRLKTARCCCVLMVLRV